MREGCGRGSFETRVRDIPAALAEMNFTRRQMVTACKNGLRRPMGGTADGRRVVRRTSRPNTEDGVRG